MGKGSDYSHISNIMSSIHAYEDSQIEQHIADLNYRIENVAQIKKITDDKRNTPIYYSYQRIKKSHQDLESVYTNYKSDSVDEKFSMISKINEIQKSLSAMEESDDEK